MALTGTRVPASIFVRSGVMKMAPSVDAVVISTDSATSPCAMYVATLLACRAALAVREQGTQHARHLLDGGRVATGTDGTSQLCHMHSSTPSMPHMKLGLLQLAEEKYAHDLPVEVG